MPDVLANDTGADDDTLEATVVRGPEHGRLSRNDLKLRGIRYVENLAPKSKENERA